MNNQPDFSSDSTILPDNIEMFSWNYLQNHPSVKPLIEKYFGKIGLNYYSNGDSRRFRSDSNTKDFETEVNNIPFDQLCEKDPVKVCCNPRFDLDDIRRFLCDRPFYDILNDFDEITLVSALLYNLAARLYHSDPDLHADPCQNYPTDTPTSNPIAWQDAMFYLRFHNHRIFALTDRELHVGRESLMCYRAVYILDKLGIDHTMLLLSRFLDIHHLAENKGRLYEFIDDALGENAQTIFLMQSKPRTIDVKQIDFPKLFRYPTWIQFTPAAHKHIIQDILSGNITDENTDYYLGTSETYENYVQLYPAICKIIRSTDNAHLLWIVGDILNLIWQNLPDDNRLHTWFRKEIYNLFWPRLGSIWPIQHYNDIHFEDPSEKRMLEDTISWITCLDDINKLNPELNTYLHQLSRHNEAYLLEEVPECIWQRAYKMRCQRCNDKQKFKLAFEQLGPEQAWRFLEHPTTIKQAEMYLNKALTDPTVSDDDAIDAITHLLVHPHADRVGPYIIEYLVHAFDTILERLHNPQVVIIFFASACASATTPDELPPLEALATKCRNMPIPDNDQEALNLNTIDTALARAKSNVKNYTREQKALTEYFLPFVPTEERKPGRPKKSTASPANIVVTPAKSKTTPTSEKSTLKSQSFDPTASTPKKSRGRPKKSAA